VRGVVRVGRAPGGRLAAITLHHARQIVSFYERYAMPETDSLVYREARAAQSVRWWRT
jgi:hypothetical protein